MKNMVFIPFEMPQSDDGKYTAPVLLFLFYHSLLTFYRLFFRGSFKFFNREVFGFIIS